MKKIICVVIIIIISLIGTISFGSLIVENEKFVGKVNTEYLNLRQGPGLKFEIISVLKKNEIINVIGKINEWYIIQTEKNIIGVCNSKYIKKIEDISIEESMLNKQNQLRKSLNIMELKYNEQLNSIAKLLNDEQRKNIEITEIRETIENKQIDFMTLGYMYCTFDNLTEIEEYLLDKKSQQYGVISNDYNNVGISIIKLKSGKYAFLQLLLGK